MSKLKDWNAKRKQKKVMKSLEEEADEINNMAKNGLMSLNEAETTTYSSNNPSSTSREIKIIGAEGILISLGLVGSLYVLSREEANESETPQQIEQLVEEDSSKPWYSQLPFIGRDEEAKSQSPAEEQAPVPKGYSQADVDSIRTAVADSVERLYATQIDSLEDISHSLEALANESKTNLNQTRRSLHKYQEENKKLAEQFAQSKGTLKEWESYSQNQHTQIKRLGDIVGAFLTDSPDSTRVMDDNILSGDTIILSGAEAKKYDPRAQKEEIYIFNKGADGEPEGFGYRLGRK